MVRHKLLKNLKNYEKVFGATDIGKAANITILEGTDFEGYLLSQGYQDLIEKLFSKLLEMIMKSKNGLKNAKVSS